MAEVKAYPAGWLQSEQYHPEEHLSRARSNSTKDDYLAVAQRLVWFVTEQRQMIAAGVATCSFIVQTKIIELDSAAGSCTCEAYIRDCLGNEASDIGTETKADFKDFAEKAATKAKGRALASLGYGTQFAPELDEGERIVDTPRKPQPQPQRPPVQQPRPMQPAPQQQDGEPMANEGQMTSLKKLSAALGLSEPETALTFKAASDLIRNLSKQYNASRQQKGA